MRAGNLRHRVNICTRELYDSSYEQRESDTLTVKDTVWAEVVTLTGTELLRAQQAAPEATHQVRIRYWRGLTCKHKIRWIDPATNDKHEFDINQINDVDQRHTEMVLICKEAAA